MLGYPLRERGSYVLELAGVMVGLSLFIIGASDVARIFQAQSAARAAVNEATRCLYPTDAACSGQPVGSVSAPIRRYDVRVWGTGYQIPQESYLATAQWTTEPVFESTALQDTLTRVSMDQEQFQAGPHTVYFPTTTNTPYFLQTAPLPRVGGTPFNPVFINPTTGEVVTPLRVPEFNRKEGSTQVGLRGRSEFDSDLEFATVTFRVSDAWPTAAQDLAAMAALPASVRGAIPCYAGATQNLGGTQVINWGAGPPQACRYRQTDASSETLMSGGTLRVPIMIRITGSTSGSEAGAEGKVLIGLSWKSPTDSYGVRGMGGRVFGAGGLGDFVPRGMGLDDLKDGISDRREEQFEEYKSEFSAHRTLTLIPIDAEVTVHFYLYSSNGRRVNWRGESMEVYFPRYRFVNEKHDCGYSANPTECAAPPRGVPASYITLKEGARFTANLTGPVSCSSEERKDVVPDVQAFLSKLEEGVRQGKAPTSTTFFANFKSEVSHCDYLPVAKDCDYKTLEYQDGCQVPMSNEDAVAHCGMVPSHGRRYRNVQVSRQTATVKQVRRKGCTDGTFEQCAQAKAREVGVEVVSGAPNCELAKTVKPAQLVVGPLYENTCSESERGSGVTDLYRSREKVPQGVPVTITKLPTEPLFSADKPTNSCIPFKAAASDEELLCGKNLSEEAAAKCCAESKGRCRKQEVVQRVSVGGGGVSTETLVSAAQQRATDTMLAGYPSVLPQPICTEGDTNCFQVNASLADNDTKAVVTARVHVPLLLMQGISKSFGTVEQSSTRVLERTAMN